MPLGHIICQRLQTKECSHSPSSALDGFLEVVIRVKVGRDAIVIEVITGIRFRDLHGIDDQTVIQARVQLNVQAAGVVPVDRLKAHVVGRAVGVVAVDGGGLDDLARSCAIWGTAKDKGVGGGEGNGRRASGRRATFWRLCFRGLSEDTARNEDSGKKGCDGVQTHDVEWIQTLNEIHESE